jgi:hypothetical protein
MASYNLMTQAGRDDLRRDRQGELDAARAGSWPRGLNDLMRWNPPRDVSAPEWAARMCEAELQSLQEMTPL